MELLGCEGRAGNEGKEGTREEPGGAAQSFGALSRFTKAAGLAPGQGIQEPTNEALAGVAQCTECGLQTK